MLLAAATTALAVPLAVGLAGLVRRSRVTLTATGLPVPVPHLVVAAVTVVALGPGGLLDRLAGGLPIRVVGDAHGVGMVLAYVYKEAPFLALVVLSAWDDATDDLLDAAKVMGAGMWRRTRDVLLPRVAPGLSTGAAVVTAFVVGAAEIPLLVGSSRSQTLATYAIDVTRLDGPAARPAATVALLVAAATAFAMTGVLALMVPRRRWTR